MINKSTNIYNFELKIEKGGLLPRPGVFKDNIVESLPEVFPVCAERVLVVCIQEPPFRVLYLFKGFGEVGIIGRDQSGPVPDPPFLVFFRI